MLINFEFSNFRSFRDTATLSMEAIPAFKELEDEAIIGTRSLRLLKSAVIYGANAAGKSNVFKAFHFMLWLLRNSATGLKPDEAISVQPYRLDTISEDAPSRFQITFVEGEEQFRYGFEVDRRAVRTEWLFVKSLDRQRARERSLFLREEENIVARKPIRDSKALIDRTRNNALFLSVAAQWDEPLLSMVNRAIGKFRAVSPIDDEWIYRNLSFDMVKSVQMREQFLRLLTHADLGIVDLRATEELLQEAEVEILSRMFPEKLREDAVESGKLLRRNVFTSHPMYRDDVPQGVVQFELSDESEGTKKYFAILGPILSALANGYTLFIDELESRLHPVLTRAIVNLFHNSETNRLGAQLIFCTHDTHLLSNRLLRRDQIWFAEKSDIGASTLYPLSDFKKVRKDDSLEKAYLEGRFGAVPLVEVPENLVLLPSGSE